MLFLVLKKHVVFDIYWVLFFNMDILKKVRARCWYLVLKQITRTLWYGELFSSGISKSAFEALSKCACEGSCHLSMFKTVRAS